MLNASKYRIVELQNLNCAIKKLLMYEEPMQIQNKQQSERLASESSQKTGIKCCRENPNCKVSKRKEKSSSLNWVF
jgi:hypothetical protein